MKTRLLFALAGLAVSFALPTFAQQTNTPDPQLRQRLIALIQKHNDAIMNNDAAAVAALYTEYGVLVEQRGADLRSGGYPETLGRQVRERAFAFQQSCLYGR
jgi:hypothetical protein